VASLGSLINPVVGVIGAVIILGATDRSDMVGFALIFSAAACVLIPQRDDRRPTRREGPATSGRPRRAIVIEYRRNDSTRLRTRIMGDRRHVRLSVA
jgi:hypothetical protein